MQISRKTASSIAPPTLNVPATPPREQSRLQSAKNNKSTPENHCRYIY